MLNQELIIYINQAKSQNIPDEQIKNILLQNGWAKLDIDMAFGGVNLPQAPFPPSPIKNDPAQGNMWDAFEHILLFISLYVLATSVGLMLNYFVDKWSPAITDVYNNYADQWQLTVLRGYLSAIIVSFPLFAFFFIQITKRTLNHPSIRNLKSRKTLIYLTLVGTFLIMLWNIIFIVYQLLNGNVTLNFILHFLVVVGISAIIFVYYLLQVKEDRRIYG